MKKAKTLENVKVGDVVTVIFSTGPAHPLYKKPTLARINGIGGYNGKCVSAETLEPVYHPEDPEGLLVFDDNANFLRYEVRPAFEKIWDGWVEEIVA